MLFRSAVAGLANGVSVLSSVDAVGSITVTLSGSASLDAYEAAIKAILFNNVDDDPDATPRVITVTVEDGFGTSAPATATLNISVLNSPPSLDLDGDDSTAAGANYATSYTENGAAVAIADVGDSLVTDASGIIMGATITLTNTQVDDVLDASMVNGLTGLTVNTSVGGGGELIITLSGTAAPAVYQAAIEAITMVLEIGRAHV